MGLSLSTVWNKLFPKKNTRILMLGLDAAGKTTILYKLKLGEHIQTVPTVGFNVDTVEYKNINFTMWDIGGQDKIRRLWRHYYQNSEALIYVVDSNDRERMEIVKEELDAMLAEDSLRDCPLLVLANKQDLPKALGVKDIIEALDLHKLKRKWYVQGACATSGEGLYEGLDWLGTAVHGK
mmetsp:Transcript_16348/g.24621  ORF Transcript_16348/g.24621 Transcript_16348/m.24621 type:complete len:180 (+) Transcript_16348:13-552(+)